MTPTRKFPLALIGLTLLVILLRLPSLEQPFDNDSGANAYHARLILRGEPLYSTHHPAHHLPAIYYVYAFAFWLFGDSMWSVKLFLILWTIATVYLLYWLGQELISEAVGILAASFYAILTSHLYFFGTSAEAELFANLPRIATIVLFVKLKQRNDMSWQYIGPGLLGMASFLFKAIYLTELILIGIIFLWELWATPQKSRQIIAQIGWISLGFIAGWLMVMAYFASLGLLSRLLLVFTLRVPFIYR